MSVIQQSPIELSDRQLQKLQRSGAIVPVRRQIFLKCVGDRLPVSIPTDQDLDLAIRIVLDNFGVTMRPKNNAR
jgi:hypothetical protein